MKGLNKKISPYKEAFQKSFGKSADEYPDQFNYYLMGAVEHESKLLKSWLKFVKDESGEIKRQIEELEKMGGSDFSVN